jgi:hypothetical protein
VATEETKSEITIYEELMIANRLPSNGGQRPDKRKQPKEHQPGILCAINSLFGKAFERLDTLKAKTEIIDSLQQRITEQETTIALLTQRVTALETRNANAKVIVRDPTSNKVIGTRDAVAGELPGTD